jgi:heme/copper-type cytochrome/quinol oxidase subunit 4
MRRTEFPHRPPRKSPKSDNSRFAILGFVASVIGSLVALVVLLPRTVVLPAFSICALAAACLMLAASMHAGRSAQVSPSAWNLAGAFTLVGCAAAILGEVEAIVEYMPLTPPRSRADD